MNNSYLKSILVLVCAIATATSISQVVNGSFENGGFADLSDWEWTCGAESIEDAPTGGGNWCLKVAGGNVKGCFPGYAYQKIPTITVGQSYTLSGWVQTQSSSPVGLYFGKIHKDTITILAGDTTTSNMWTPLNIQSTFTLSPGDTAVVVLFGGIAAGPFQGFGYFDLINLQEITGVHLIPEPSSFKVSPNPFSSETILHTDMLLKDVSLGVYDMIGQLRRQEHHISGPAYSFSRGDLSPGIYFLQFTQEAMVIGIIKIAITDF